MKNKIFNFKSITLFKGEEQKDGAINTFKTIRLCSLNLKTDKGHNINVFRGAKYLPEIVNGYKLIR